MTPAMYQTIPVDQYLDRYVFVTGANYSKNYAQVIRRKANADVFIDGVAVEGWYTLNSTGLNIQVADVDLGPTGDAGVHEISSPQPAAALGASPSCSAWPGGSIGTSTKSAPAGVAAASAPGIVSRAP